MNSINDLSMFVLLIVRRLEERLKRSHLFLNVFYLFVCSPWQVDLLARDNESSEGI